MTNEILDIGFIWELLDPRSIVYLTVVLLVFYLAKKTFDILAPYDLNHQLTVADNKAVALTFAGYLFSVGVIVLSVLKSEEHKGGAGSVAVAYLTDLGVTVAWCLFGIVLLHLARLVNDKLIFRKFRNLKELLEDRNLGTGAVECGSYVGSGLIINAALSGESTSVSDAVLSTLLFFVMGQVVFILFGVLYQMVTRFDVHEQIEKDNTAAGVSVAMNLIAIGVLLSGFIRQSDSLPALGVWFVISSLLLLTSRYLVDKFMLPGQLLDEEVKSDRNWGAALVEGASAIAISFIVNACFLA